MYTYIYIYICYTCVDMYIYIYIYIYKRPAEKPMLPSEADVRKAFSTRRMTLSLLGKASWLTYRSLDLITMIQQY